MRGAVKLMVHVVVCLSGLGGTDTISKIFADLDKAKQYAEEKNNDPHSSEWLDTYTVESFQVEV
jgi:hypothetical protein